MTRELTPAKVAVLVLACRVAADAYTKDAAEFAEEAKRSPAWERLRRQFASQAEEARALGELLENSRAVRVVEASPGPDDVIPFRVAGRA